MSGGTQCRALPRHQGIEPITVRYLQSHARAPAPRLALMYFNTFLFLFII